MGLKFGYGLLTGIWLTLEMVAVWELFGGKEATDLGFGVDMFGFGFVK